MFWMIIGVIVYIGFLLKKANQEVGIEAFSIPELLFIILIGFVMGGAGGGLVYLIMGSITANSLPTEYTTETQVLDSFGDSSNIYLVENDDGEHAWGSYYYITDNNEVQKTDTYDYYVQVEDSNSPYLVEYEPHFTKSWYKWFVPEEALINKYEFHIPENALIKINTEE